MLFVTGGAGFIGSNFILDYLAQDGAGPILNIDKLTYAGNPENLHAVAAAPGYAFAHTDVCDEVAISALFALHRPCAIIHFAAESHVDRSILAPGEFVRTNVNGTHNLLDKALKYWQGLPASARARFRFVHISTVDVFGSLGPSDAPATETSPYAPNSPYSASKAAADHLVRAYHSTYGLPTLAIHCANNYGPYQFPEKLIPLVISNALDGRPLPLYGDGQQIRDWLHVADHCTAIRAVLEGGVPGETYNVGSGQGQTNLQVVETVCSVLDALSPRNSGSYRDLITFVTDRPGHDRRYALDSGKIRRELGWQPRESFASGIHKTLRWYLDHTSWVAKVKSGAYLDWMSTQYGTPAAT